MLVFCKVVIYNDGFQQRENNSKETRLNGLCASISHIKSEVCYFVNDAFIMVVFRNLSL